MVKTVFKEIIITILLCIVILLVLSVIFYDYNPINKIVPSKIEQYTTPENIQEEISTNITELETTNIVYKVEGSDLNMYIKTNTYIQGKANPFETVSTEVNGETTDNNQSSNTSGESNSSNNTNSDETFWNSTGTK